MKLFIIFILKHWKFSLAIVAYIIISGIMINNQIENSKQRKQAQREYNAKLADLRASVADSVYYAREAIKLAEIDSIKAVEGLKAENAINEAAKWKNQANKYNKEAKKQKQYADSLATVYKDSDSTECLDLIEAYEEVVETITVENNSLRVANGKLGLAITHLETEMNYCEQQSAIKDSIIISKDELIQVKDKRIEVLEKGNKKKECFLKRAVRWLFGG